MFGKRGNKGFGQAADTMVKAPPLAPDLIEEKPTAGKPEPAAAEAPVRTNTPIAPGTERPEKKRRGPKRDEGYYTTKSQVFSALIDTIDLSQLSKLENESAREEIRDIVNDIITIKNFAMSISEQEELLEDICNDVLGYGPLEPLLARDDIADIMINGSGQSYIEVEGKVEETEIRFRDETQLLSICQRIVSQVGRRVDESSPICDARLPDGSRVNVIAPPLSIDGTALTIRKFKKDKLTLDQLVGFGSITQAGATILQIIGRVRCNVVISGGTGSGKTTLLNCLTRYIDTDREGDHLRGLGGTAAAAAACGPAGNPPAQHRGRGRGDDARSRQELPAHAAGTDHRRRGPWTRGFRPAAGDEHRPRRIDGHHPLQLAARMSQPYGIDDRPCPPFLNETR